MKPHFENSFEEDNVSCVPHGISSRVHFSERRVSDRAPGGLDVRAVSSRRDPERVGAAVDARAPRRRGVAGDRAHPLLRRLRAARRAAAQTHQVRRAVLPGNRGSPDAAKNVTQMCIPLFRVMCSINPVQALSGPRLLTLSVNLFPQDVHLL